MKRSLTISWSDPAALAEAGRSMAGIEFLRAICEGKLYAHASTTCIVLGNGK